VGGDSHGDTHPAPQIPTGTTTITTGAAHPVPPSDDLHPHGSLSQPQPTSEEIEAGGLAASTASGDRPASSGAAALTAGAQQPATANQPLVNTTAHIILPDLARELQLEQNPKVTGLKGGCSGEDPLIRDLIQRFNHKEIRRDLAAEGDTSANPPPRRGVMGAEKRYTQAERGRGVDNLQLRKFNHKDSGHLHSRPWWITAHRGSEFYCKEIAQGQSELSLLRSSTD
jgi:hypothetical protein